MTAGASGGEWTHARAFEYLPATLAARLGNVNVVRGSREDVLFVNARAGDDRTREISLAVGEPIRAVVAAPSSRLHARFALYAWLRIPDASTVTRLPRDVGSLVLPIPFTGGSPQPRVIWNNLCATQALGSGSAPSHAAPTLLFDRASGAPRAMSASLQGLIVDDGSPSPL